MSSAGIRLLSLALIATLASLVPAGAAAGATDSTAASELITRSEVRAMLDSLAERVRDRRTDAAPRPSYGLSGYVQARFEWGEASSDTVRVSGSPPTASVANVSRFYVRRGRVKLTADPSPRTRVVLSVDGSQDRMVRLLDAYVTIKEGWTGRQAHQLTVGQFDVPFGFEIERSSSRRELPERSRAENVLFSGERDRGIKLEGQWTPRLRTVVALLNGGGVQDPDFPTTDPTRAKDVLGRARWSVGGLDVAASYAIGRDVIPLTGPDVWTDRKRLGADAQASYSLPGLGKGQWMLEFYSGVETNPDSVRGLVETVDISPGQQARRLRAGADPTHLATRFRGGYAMCVQRLSERTEGVVRHDRYDPDLAAGHDQFSRWSFGLNLVCDSHTRLTIAYDAVRTEKPSGGSFRDPADNLWTFQVQSRF